MKNFGLLCTLFAVFIITATSAQQVKVMTYNIRLNTASDGENRWDNRKEMLTGQVLFYEPDFMGVQEALPEQMQFLNTNLDSIYSSIGAGRDDGKNKGEFSAVFYNKKKYKLIESNTFWLSETPEKPSKGWDAAYNRVCTYGKFKNTKTGQELWMFNTHFDHVGDVARNESAKLILKTIQEVNKQNLPFILTGDFNLEPESQPIITISKEMNDSKLAADFTYGPQGTFNGFEFTKPVTNRIDYIFTSKNGIKVKKYAVLSNSDLCRYPSDHFPVYAELEIKK
ncbi:endonuclease/exonuclease/phosphatase family protein [Flavobacterium rhizosphaerae]|uniref:Endonuclease/exonuclease/phosphatase family protein n=1 Tax=Flavobacterium rhizosphaerae TaxID=3163298 RepID=A0ABW8YU27_9FLAO